MWILEILIFIVTVAVATHLWRLKKFIDTANKIPKSPFVISMSNVFELFNWNTKKFLAEVSKGEATGLVRTWLGPVLIVSVVMPEDVKIAMNARECVDKPAFIKNAVNVPKGLLFGDIELWQRHRKMLNPYFTPMALRSFVPIFNARVKILMNNLKKAKSKGAFDVFHYLAALSLETILSVMEYDVDIQNLEKHKRDSFIKNLETFIETANTRMFKVWLHVDFIFNRSSYKEIQKKAKINSGMHFTPDIIKRTRDKMAESNEDHSGEKERSRTFIREILSVKHQLTDSEITDEIDTFIGAAHDTTAIASSATLLLLAMHKDKQENVVEELRRVVGTPSEDLYLDIEKINELKYLEMAINEAMRLIPVTPLVFRTNEKDIISSEGYTIPAGTTILFPILKIHKSKEFWGDDAEEFKPERFSKENISKIHPYAFLPFAKGPRMCIGWRYAMFLMKIQLTNILLKYEIDTNLKLDELEFDMKITLSVCQGFKISMKERE